MLSVIITSLNENNLVLNNTVQSIFNSTFGNTLEIIVVDDHSDIPVEIKNKHPNIILHRNKFRMGVAQSRHFGACMAKYKWLLFTDSHMLFDTSFYSKFLIYQLSSKHNTIYNGCCLGLWQEDILDWKNINLNKLPKYYGARLSLYEEKENQILEGKWNDGIKNKDEDNYDISCLMGAIYFIRKKFFFEIRGLQDLKGWGSDEPLLSLKTLLCGGEIKQVKKIVAAHAFRAVAPYRTFNKHMIYNKIRMAKTLLPEEMGRLLISKLPRSTEFFEAIELINNENKFIEEHREYYKSIFTKSINEICEKFNIKIPNE